MIRCYHCNTKLNEQSHFCNVCGFSQNLSEPPLKLPASGEQKISAIKKTNLCDNCAAELPQEARFCAACGSAQASHEASVSEKTSIKRAKSTITSENNESSNVHLQPLKSHKSAQGKQQSDGQTPNEADKVSIHSKTDTNSPIFPTQLSKNSAKSTSAIQQHNTSQNGTSTKPSTTNSPNPPANKETTTTTSQSVISDSVLSESTSSISAQTNMDVAEPLNTPGLIRSITPKTSTRTVIPSRPDSAESIIATQPTKQISQTPAYSIPVPSSKLSLSKQEEAQQHSKFSNKQPDEHGQDKQQFAERATQQNQVYSQQEFNKDVAQSGTQDQNIRVQKTPIVSLWQDSTTAYSNGENSMSDTPKTELLSPASFMTTSKAAERWRKSWRDRQYAEAGPAENVSRGQASVPMPLMAMQQSFVRMRAIEKNNSNQRSKRSVNFSTWITILVMICLIIGLSTYIFSSYLPNSPFGLTHITSSTNTIKPTISIVGAISQSVRIGKTIQFRGKHFGVNREIIFLRDATIPIVDKNGINISAQTDTQGAFEATIPIDTTWTMGSHSIEAIDNSNSQIAFLTLQVIPNVTPKTTSTELSVSMDGKPSTLLAFKAIVSQENPGPQRITIINISGAPLKWTATATANNNLNWLMINDNNNDGQLDISQPHSILISVNTVGLPINLYKGQIIFTINNNHQLTIPVQLQIIDTTPEMVFSPNPIIAQIGPGNTCQPGVSMTLINLGVSAIRWAVNPDDNIKGNIKFVSNSNGQTLESGTLLPSGSQSPSGQPGDTIVLTLQCTNIRVGLHYHVSVYANQMSWSELVIVQ